MWKSVATNDFSVLLRTSSNPADINRFGSHTGNKFLTWDNIFDRCCGIVNTADPKNNFWKKTYCYVIVGFVKIYYIYILNLEIIWYLIKYCLLLNWVGGNLISKIWEIFNCFIKEFTNLIMTLEAKLIYNFKILFTKGLCTNESKWFLELLVVLLGFLYWMY